LLGTFHGSDILQVFFGILPNYASAAFHAYYLSFVNDLDPNKGNLYSEWPLWKDNQQLLNMYPLGSTLIPDTFRSDTVEFIGNNVGSLRI